MPRADDPVFDDLDEETKRQARLLLYPEEREKSADELLREAYIQELAAEKIEEEARSRAAEHRGKAKELVTKAKAKRTAEEKLAGPPRKLALNDSKKEVPPEEAEGDGQ